MISLIQLLLRTLQKIKCDLHLTLFFIHCIAFNGMKYNLFCVKFVLLCKKMIEYNGNAHLKRNSTSKCTIQHCQ